MPSRKRKVENTLNLTHSAVANVVGLDSAQSTIALTNLAEVQHLIKVTGNILNLTQSVTHDLILSLTALNILQLTQEADPDGTKQRAVNSNLVFNQEVTTQLKTNSVSNTLSLTHFVSGAVPKLASASNNLTVNSDNFDPDDLIGVDPNDPEAIDAILAGIGLRHTATARLSIIARGVTSHLDLSQEAGQGIFVTASNHLSLSHAARTVLHELLISNLRLSHSAIGDNVKWAEDILALTQSLLLTGVRSRSASSILDLNSSVSQIISNFCGYSPGIGAGSFTYPAPSIVAPTLIRRTSTVLTWPYAAPTVTLTLRNPNFDNVEQFEFRRINRRTKGGDLDLFRDETWPKVKRLIYSFSELKETQRNELFTFLIRSIGQEIGILDFESRQWRGIILTPSSAVAEPRSGGFGFSLDFEGELA